MIPLGTAAGDDRLDAATRARLLERMDLNMWEMWRENARGSRDGTVFDTRGATFVVLPSAMQFHNSVLVRDKIELDALLDAAALFYGEEGPGFSVWIRAHADLKLEHKLRERGYKTNVSLPAMALLNDPGTRREPEGLEIRPVSDRAGLAAYTRVIAESYAVFGQPPEVAEALFADLSALCAPHIQGFVGYHAGKPTAAAVVCVTHGVAGINWVGSIPAARGKGHAEAVVWAATREGLSRGAEFANLQASPMGFGLYRKMGFIAPSEYRMYIEVT